MRWLKSDCDVVAKLAGLGAVLGRGPDRLRIIVPDVGGAFGSKGVPQAETVAVALAALRLGRPVKWAETRTESSLAVYQGRGQQIEAELALDEDGLMLALRARVVADLGAFLYSTTPVAPLTCGQLLAGPYAIPAVGVEVVGVRTNKVPTGPYRGAGRPEAALALERLVDVAAAEAGIDRVELRRRNLVRRFPHDNGLGLTYDSGDYDGALTAALELADYRGLTREAARARATGGLAGVGLALYVERVGPGWESAEVAIEADGHVIVRTGASSHGQGHETTFAQIAADALGVDPGAVEVRSGDSWEIPSGMGTFASRSTTIGGSAILLAAREVRQRLEAGEAPPIEANARFELPGAVFSSGAYVAAVTVERSTGEVRVTKVVAVDDCGFVVNPLLAEGQVVGGTVQGIGEALYEQVGYDEDGQPLAVNFHAYRLPTALSVPPITTALRETASPWNPLGAKGVGEGGSIGTPAAVANAVADALSAERRASHRPSVHAVAGLGGDQPGSGRRLNPAQSSRSPRTIRNTPRPSRTPTARRFMCASSQRLNCSVVAVARSGTTAKPTSGISMNENMIRKKTTVTATVADVEYPSCAMSFSATIADRPGSAQSTIPATNAYGVPLSSARSRRSGFLSATDSSFGFFAPLPRRFLRSTTYATISESTPTTM